MSKRFIVGTGTALGIVGLVFLGLQLSAAAPDSGSGHEPLVPPSPTSEAASPQAAVSDILSARPAPVAATTPEPLDCERPTGSVALVAGRNVSADVLCEALDATVGPSPAMRSGRGPELLEHLVDHALIDAELEARGLVLPEAELKAELERVNTTGQSPYVRDAIEARLALRLLVGAKAASIDRTALEAEYTRDPSRWATPGKARLDGYLARTPVGASAELSTEAERRATRVFEALAAGARDIADVAVQAAMEPLNGWSLESSGLEPALEAAVFSVDRAPDKWLGPIQTRVGWVVVHTSAVVMPTPRPFEVVEADVRRALEARRTLEAERVLVARLRQDAVIERLVAW